MAVGETFHWSKKSFRDPRTGREIWQLTEGSHTSYAPYMYRRAFSHDERFVVCSSNRSGSMQVYRIEIESGEAIQLTDVDYQTEHMNLTLDPAGREAYLLTATALVAVDILSGELRRVADYAALTGGRAAHSFTLTADGKLAMMHYLRPDGISAIAVALTDGSEQPREIHRFAAHVQRITHILLCPTDPNLVTYNRHPDRQDDQISPPSDRARCWLIDLRNGEDKPFLVAPLRYRATHEYWAPDGSGLYFHQKHVPNWVPASICFLRRDSGLMRAIYQTPTIKLGHSSVSYDQTRIVSDSQHPGTNEMLLIDTRAGNAEVLCWPNASGRPHPNHVHPAFSPSARKILYTSDCSGSAQVYLIPQI